LRAIVCCERRQRGRRGGSDRVEDAEQRIGVSGCVAADQIREVEVVARVHAHAIGQKAAQRDLLAASSSETLMPSTFAAFAVDDLGADIRRARMVGSLRAARATQ
jgi:hypothetical protein